MNRLIVLVFGLMVLGGARAAGTGADPYAAVYDRVLQGNADRAVKDCSGLQAALESGSTERRHAAFVELAKAWASVQASYILGGYDIDAMDYPLMIDYFHMGKEDVRETLGRLIESDTPASKALYKNSYKTMGALDAVMFSGPWSDRRAELASVIAGNLCRRLAQIRDGYREHRADFLGDRDKALSLLINAEIESIYKTRDWRIAQVAGLTRRSLGQQMPQNQQYPYSHASWAVIGAIIDTHEQLLGEDRQPNVASIAHGKKADAGLAAVQEALQATEQAYRETRPDHGFATRDMIPVFQGLLDLQQAFYRHLVASVGVTANLIDADGD
jgi:hypothetical protein